MEKSQYELCVEVLRRLDRADVLRKFIIIGSWCIPFYKSYFAQPSYVSSIKTRDIDFLVPIPLKIQRKVDVPELLKDIGFVIGFKGSPGYIKLEHPELVIEFLVPEKGRGLGKPYPLPQLGLNAQSLRFLDFLTRNTTHIEIEGVPVILPHPANFALHKLIISQRRENQEKTVKDRESAVKILKALINNHEQDIIINTFRSAPKRWQKKIKDGLEKTKEEEITDILSA